MKVKMPPFLRSYGFSIVLVASILFGAVLGIVFKKDAALFKPLGDVFLNLLFTIIVPLVFFSISATVASMTDLRRLGKILGVMVIIFVATGLVASAVMLAAVLVFPPAAGVHIAIPAAPELATFSAAQQLVRAFTVPDFPMLLSKNNMLALIVVSMLVGLAASAAGEKGRAFTLFLDSAKEVMLKLISLVMYYAPVGFVLISPTWSEFSGRIFWVLMRGQWRFITRRRLCTFFSLLHSTRSPRDERPPSRPFGKISFRHPSWLWPPAARWRQSPPICRRRIKSASPVISVKSLSPSARRFTWKAHAWPLF